MDLTCSLGAPNAVPVAPHASTTARPDAAAPRGMAWRLLTRRVIDSLAVFVIVMALDPFAPRKRGCFCEYAFTGVRDTSAIVPNSPVIATMSIRKGPRSNSATLTRPFRTRLDTVMITHFDSDWSASELAIAC